MLSSRPLHVLLLVSTVCLIIVAGVHARAAAQGGDQKSAFVTVVSDGDAPLRELKAADFVVHEGKSDRPVTDARLATEPMAVALVVDTTMPVGGMAPPTQELRPALHGFVNALRKGNPGCDISLASVAGSAAPAVLFGASPSDLDKAIDGLASLKGSGAAMFEALSDAGKQVAAKPAPRRAIVAIDFNSPEISPDQTIKHIAENVHNTGATIWAITIRPAGATPSSRTGLMSNLTKDSGGLWLTGVEPASLSALLARVANSLLSQYTITFTRDGNVNPRALQFDTKAGVKVLLTPWMR